MKKYKIIYYGIEEYVFEVDVNNKTLECMKESLLFFMGGQEYIDEADGDIIIAYITMISKKVIIDSIDWNRNGIIDEFKDKEGFLPLDGSFGIKLISSDSFEIDENEIIVEED